VELEEGWGEEEDGCLTGGVALRRRGFVMEVGYRLSELTQSMSAIRRLDTHWLVHE